MNEFTILVTYFALEKRVNFSQPRPHDHKLRKFLSLKLDIEYLKFYWTHWFNNLQMWTKCTPKKSLKFWFINKTTAKVILVWNFDLRIFSVYGHGARLYSRYIDEALGPMYMSQSNNQHQSIDMPKLLENKLSTGAMFN